ncbi:MAG: NRDE family protein [Cytophagales bacterium]
MCTVTFFKTNSGFIITSNRDENIARESASEIFEENLGSSKLYYPLDPKSRGSWFCMKSNGSVFVLLNGATKNHLKKPNYRKSRGLILMEIAKSESFMLTWLEIELDEIEPFTLIICATNNLFQLQWDGTSKKLKKIDPNFPKIWSSSTLYSPEIRKEREKWFQEFIKQNQNQIDEMSIWRFHTETEKENLDNGLMINRNLTMLTKNVTQCHVTQKKIEIKHLDTVNGLFETLNTELTI